MEEVVREEIQQANQAGRDAFNAWQTDIQKNIYTSDADYKHTIEYYFADRFLSIETELESFGQMVVNELEPLVSENNLAINLPRLEAYNSIGERVDRVIHHPTYVQAGNIIYNSGLLAKMANSGGLSECLSLLFLSAQAGEAGHNCPIACSAGIIRTLQKIPDFPDKAFYIEKLTLPLYQINYTGAQFLTEIQGGSDVGLNAAYAKETNKNTWRIYGEKWFCSNAGADLIFITARYNQSIPGTKGLGLFLIPAEWNGSKNNYTIRRLKDKIGTRSMATGEIDFHGAYALQVGTLQEGFHLVMDNVLHLSRLFNTFCVLGMARRAYHIARSYALHRIAFAQPIIYYPLVKETLARIKTENSAMLAGIFATVKMQDEVDKGKLNDKNIQLLLRLLVNIQKYLSARWSVEHIHHSLDVLAGNGTIETFSSIPRLFRDCIVCENWEGTHNVLRAQVLKDIQKYNIDQIYLAYMQKEINTLVDTHPQAQTLAGELKKLERYIAEFRKLDHEVQALQIQFVVDKMAILYCATMLLIEAIDQQQTRQSTSKQACYDYFYMLHLNKNEIRYDKSYIELTSRILS